MATHTRSPSSSSSSSSTATRRGKGAGHAMVAAAAMAAVLLRVAPATATAARRGLSSSCSSSSSSSRGGGGLGLHAFLILPSSHITRHGTTRPFRGAPALAAVAKGRPSLDDVERISKGQAAKRRGVGSRAVCHRLNEMERKEFDLAKKLGFVQLRGTGYRRERKGSPLANIHRQLCDAMGRPCVEIHRGLGTDAVDEVVVDLSPFRPTEPGELDEALAVCRALEAELLPGAADAGKGEPEGLGEKWEAVRASFSEDDWETKAIWELPVLCFVYDCTGDRALAKKVAQEAHARLGKLKKRR